MENTYKREFSKNTHKAIAKAIERAKINIKWLKVHSDNIDEWFDLFGYNVASEPIAETNETSMANMNSVYKLPLILIISVILSI